MRCYVSLLGLCVVYICINLSVFAYSASHQSLSDPCQLPHLTLVVFGACTGFRIRDIPQVARVQVLIAT